MCLRFEDLILERESRPGTHPGLPGCSAASPRRSPAPQAVAVLAEAIAPKKSGTFRKGQPGNWREHFTPANKALFKEQAGDLLIHLGYEQDNSW